jgi:hypothetical protein
MNASQSIRAWLEIHGTHPSRDVADALGLSRKTAAQLLATMVNEGTVTADDKYPRNYTFLRHAVPATERIQRANAARLGAERVDPAARRERARARDRAYYWRTHERMLAKKRTRTRTTAPRVLLTPEQRDANRLAYEAKRRESRRLERQSKALAALAKNAARAPLMQAPKVERIETYEEFIARGGHVERVRAHWEAA